MEIKPALFLDVQLIKTNIHRWTRYIKNMIKL